MVASESSAVSLGSKVLTIGVRLLRFAHVAVALTAARVVLTPLVVMLLVADRVGASVGVFLVAAATDVLDGMVARALNTVTRFGAALDPIADKVLIGTMLGCFVYLGDLPMWSLLLITGIQILRWVGGVLFAWRTKVVLMAGPDGKVTHWLFIVLVVVLYLAPSSFVIPLCLALLAYVSSSLVIVRRGIRLLRGVESPRAIGRSS